MRRAFQVVLRVTGPDQGEGHQRKAAKLPSRVPRAWSVSSAAEASLRAHGVAGVLMDGAILIALSGVLWYWVARNIAFWQRGQTALTCPLSKTSTVKERLDLAGPVGLPSVTI